MIKFNSFYNQTINFFNIKRLDIKLPRQDLFPPFSLLDVMLREMSSYSLLNVHTNFTTSTEQFGILHWKSFNFVVSDSFRLKLISYPTQSLAWSTALVVMVPLHKTKHRVGSNKKKWHTNMYTCNIQNAKKVLSAG